MSVVPTGGGDGNPQFRFAQPPSKVLHVRNLPWEVTEDELLEMCRPFGKVLNTKTNVGANQNQAFVEFADLNQAINMVSFYAASSEPAQIRGKAVYLQYSTRQEITSMGSKAGGGGGGGGGPDAASNVLLVTMENVEAKDVSIEVLHVVFSAFGFVQKIATFEKSAGFQALVQYADADTASSAKQALDGHSIPSYLLPETVPACNLRISFSAHNDLNVKFQSHRSRDYTNPYLPVSSSASEGGPGVPLKRENESNVLLASIDNMQYNVTIDVLHTVFSAFGFVQKIAIFEKSAGFQALVQYPDVATAVAAKDALEGHCIYDGGFCKLRLSFSRHTDLNVKANNDRSRDYTKPDHPSGAALPLPGAPPAAAGILGQPPGAPGAHPGPPPPQPGGGYWAAHGAPPGMPPGMGPGAPGGSPGAYHPSHGPGHPQGVPGVGPHGQGPPGAGMPPGAPWGPGGPGGPPRPMAPGAPGGPPGGAHSGQPYGAPPHAGGPYGQPGAGLPGPPPPGQRQPGGGGFYGGGPPGGVPPGAPGGPRGPPPGGFPPQGGPLGSSGGHGVPPQQQQGLPPPPPMGGRPHHPAHPGQPYGAPPGGHHYGPPGGPPPYGGPKREGMPEGPPGAPGMPGPFRYPPPPGANGGGYGNAPPPGYGY